MPEARLSVRNLTTVFHAGRGVLRAVDGTSFDVSSGQTVALMGDSGAGKSLVALSLLRLVPDPPGKVVAGEVQFRGRDLLKLPARDLCRVRGAEIAMIFQEPLAVLGASSSVGMQITQILRIHGMARGRRARDRALDVLHEVGISSPTETYAAFAHQLPGGTLRQVMIAMALVCSPALLLADEPTAGLDPTVRTWVLELLGRLRTERQTSILLITHDLDSVLQLSQRALVMHAGRIVESAPTAELFAAPRHPYTQGLLAAHASSAAHGQPRAPRLPMIGGLDPDLEIPAPGCRFAERCPKFAKRGDAICGEREPDLLPLGGEHAARCHFATEDRP